MTMNPISATRRSLRRPLALAWVAAVLAGCGSNAAPASSPLPSIRLEPVESQDAAPLPALPVAQTGGAESGGQRIESLEVVDQDLRVVVRGLAESYGLDFQIDPGIEGRVTTRLRDVTLNQALDEIILPHGYSYQLQGRVLRVTPSRLETRIFTLDYMSLSRTGIGTTVIQRRLGNTSGAGGVGVTGVAGLASGGGDIIQTVTVADLWEEIRVSLEGLIFDAALSSATGAPASAGGAIAPRAPGAFSRVDSAGTRLIINPLSGTILISAPAEKLAEVAAFLSTIEGSVQRQVLIEAKIVEVTLSQRFEFGIDWSVVQRVGGVNLRLAGGESGAQFALAPQQGDAEREINVVLRALEQQGDVSVLSSPRVSVMNNQRAVMNATKDEVFFTVTRQPVIGPTGGTIGFNTEIVPQQIAVGITLDVFPQIAPDNTITMNVRPVITDVVEVREVRLEDGTQASAPVIDRRETDTVVRVRGGETIVIGGLIQSTRRNSRGGVPGLSRIPGVGRLFGGSSEEMVKRELVIFITPRIIAGQPPIAQ